MPGSTSPERVPMTKPANGVIPIDVSTAMPPRIADAEAPLPRCSVIWFTSSAGLPSSSGMCWDTYSWLVPWNPYLRTPCSAATSALIAYTAAAGGTVLKKPVSNTATWGTSESRLRATSMPSIFAGLCSGASGIRSRTMPSTSSVMITGWENKTPPCTTRCPTAEMCTSSRPQPCSPIRANAMSRPAE